MLFNNRHSIGIVENIRVGFLPSDKDKENSPIGAKLGVKHRLVFRNVPVITSVECP